MTNTGDNTVSVINTATNMVVGMPISVGSDPTAVAITPDGTRVYVFNTLNNNVSVIDTATNMVVVTIPVGTLPVGVAMTPDGTRAYVANDGSGNVSVIDTATNMVVGMPIPVGFNPRGVAIAIIPSPFINLSPVAATNDVLTEHTVTATVNVDKFPVPGILVAFEVISGPNAGEISDPDSGECTPNDDCTTDANGEVSWTYTGSKFPGTDTIVASFFREITQTVEESNTVEKIWERVPISTPTLSEWGLIAMATVLGLVGFMVIRRRKVTA